MLIEWDAVMDCSGSRWALEGIVGVNKHRRGQGQRLGPVHMIKQSPTRETLRGKRYAGTSLRSLFPAQNTGSRV
jgi:hypothetical protein